MDALAAYDRDTKALRALKSDTNWSLPVIVPGDIRGTQIGPEDTDGLVPVRVWNPFLDDYSILRYLPSALKAL